MTGAHGSYLGDGWCGVVVWVTLCHKGIRHWVPRQGIRGFVLDTLHTLRGEVVGHGAAFESLEMWIINFIESVVVEDRYKGMVGSDNCDVWEA